MAGKVHCFLPSWTVIGRAMFAIAIVVSTTSTSLVSASSGTLVAVASSDPVEAGSSSAGASLAARAPRSMPEPMASCLMRTCRPTMATEAGVGACRSSAVASPIHASRTARSKVIRGSIAVPLIRAVTRCRSCSSSVAPRPTAMAASSVVATSGVRPSSAKVGRRMSSGRRTSAVPPKRSARTGVSAAVAWSVVMPPMLTPATVTPG